VLRPFLRAWWEGKGCPSWGPVFPVARGQRTGEARGKSSYALRVRRAFLKAGATRHELHHDTPTSRKLNFHSTGRRAFSTALAKSGVNEQTAMALTHHADSRVHNRYVGELAREVPASALPSLGSATPAGWATAVSKRSKRSPVTMERDTGFEPATSSLGSSQASLQSGAVITLAPWSWVERALRVPPCFGVSLREKSPAGSYTGDSLVHPGEMVWS
jgi:hypothetical protein